MTSLADRLAAVEAALPDDLEAIRGASTRAQVDEQRVRLTGRRSELSTIASSMKEAPQEERPELGRRISALQNAVEDALASRMATVQQAEQDERLRTEKLDLSLPGRRPHQGIEHLITRTQREVEDLFVGMGYRVIEGPEVETDWYCFEALNIPKVHPARSMQDTLYVASTGAPDEVLLRTHTSAVQVRHMQAEKPPIYIIAPGRTIRRDSVDATHIPVFHQFEGLVVDEGITFGHLAGTLEWLARALFGPERTIRLRPSYFPYTEPSAEIDISCFICNGKGFVLSRGSARNAGAATNETSEQGAGFELPPDTPEGCHTCHGSGWIEMGGSGMVHPALFERVGYDPEKVSGFAFGMGIERIALLRHGIPDLRLFVDNDLRFLEQFRA